MSMLSRFATTGGGGDPYWANVSLLLTGANLVDSSSSPKTITNTGSVSVSTYVKQYGSGSLQFNGENRLSIVTPPDSIIKWYSTSYTLEYWINPTSFGSGPSGYTNVLGNSDPAGITEYWSFGPNSSRAIIFYYYNGGQAALATSTQLSSGAWSFIVFVKNGTSLSIYINGVLYASATVIGIPMSSNTVPFNIGQNTTSKFTGYIQDLRITYGVARYSGSTCPVPTAPFPTYGP